MKVDVKESAAVAALAQCIGDQEHQFAPFSDMSFRSVCETCALAVDECPACDGDGKEPMRTVRGEVVEDDCRECGGLGYVRALDAPRAASSGYDQPPSPPTT